MKTKTDLDVDQLAHDFAARYCRAVVVLYCQRTRSGSTEWYDTRLLKPKLGGGDFREELDVALRYLALRGDALPFRLVCSRAFPHLVKFEEEQACP